MPKHPSVRQHLLAATILAGLVSTAGCQAVRAGTTSTPPTLLPSGQYITPDIARGASFVDLDPHLADNPGYRATHAGKTALSPDGRTLLILTSGYNRLNYIDGPMKGQADLADSNEYVFVYDVSGAHAQAPVQTQVLQVPNSFFGLVWAPDGQHFYVAGGASDAVFSFAQSNGAWALSGTTTLNHASYANNLTGSGTLLAPFLSNGIGFIESASTAGLAVTPDGATLVAANAYNDSISVIDTATGTVRWEYDLRPYNNTPELNGLPGGETPFAVVIKGNANAGYTAYVASVRDREMVAVPLRSIPPDGGTVVHIPLPGNPNGVALSPDQTKLYVTQDNSDQIAIIDTTTDTVIGAIDVLAIPSVFAHGTRYRGAAPNSLAISPDARTMYVSDGGANAVSVIDLKAAGGPAPIGLIPTGWYPHSVSVSADGGALYIVNGKSDPGPNPQFRLPRANQYVLQREKAGFLTLPTPTATELAGLTTQVATNNAYGMQESGADRQLMAALHAKIHHVIYIVKENRTFDQVLGDLGNGSNGDPSLTQYGHFVTPNFHRIATQFVTLDNFFCSGEVSGNGWAWSTEARESDFGVKTIPINYAGRGSSNDSEGSNRVVDVGLLTPDRVAAFPNINGIGNLYETLGNAFPGGYINLLPGTYDDFATDGPVGTPPQQGYLWDAAFRAGLSVRNYGFFVDIVRYNIPVALGGVPLVENPFAAGMQSAWPTNPTLAPATDIYFRGFDNAYPDTWRYEEWNREFQGYVAGANLPNLTLLRLMHDHTGNFCPKPYTAASCPAAHLNTPDLQQADNDYAVGRVVDTVAHSPYAADTLIFVLEDDSQAGPDHVDAHRSTAYVIGPYVKTAAVVTQRYTTVNMVRTIEEVLGADYLNLNDANQGPMSDLFDLNNTQWTYKLTASPLLKPTGLLNGGTQFSVAGSARPVRDGDWWARATRGFDWSKEDRVPADQYNRLMWEGMKPGVPYPETRSGADLRNTPK